MIVTGTNQHHHMQRALQLAERGRGRTSPNPLTGCVVVKDGRVIGEGFHERHGARHAEAAALDACSETRTRAAHTCTATWSRAPWPIPASSPRPAPRASSARESGG